MRSYQMIIQQQSLHRKILPVSKSPKTRIQPKSPAVRIRPKSPKLRSRPNSPKVRIQSNSPKARVQPKSPTTLIRPTLQKARLQPAVPIAFGSTTNSRPPLKQKPSTTSNSRAVLTCEPPPSPCSKRQHSSVVERVTGPPRLSRQRTDEHVSFDFSELSFCGSNVLIESNLDRSRFEENVSIKSDSGRNRFEEVDDFLRVDLSFGDTTLYKMALEKVMEALAFDEELTQLSESSSTPKASIFLHLIRTSPTTNCSIPPCALQLSDGHWAAMKHGADALRSLVRMKISDNSDLERARMELLRCRDFLESSGRV